MKTLEYVQAKIMENSDILSKQTKVEMNGLVKMNSKLSLKQKRNIVDIPMKKKSEMRTSVPP